MIVILTLLYLGLVYAAFKYIKIKVNPISIAGAALGGVILLGGIVTVWKLASPMSGQVTLRRVVVQITPNVREFVTKVHVESNELVHKGQPLFEISKERFQNAVDQASASLSAAEATVKQLEAAYEAARASVDKAVADEGVAKVNIDTAKRLKRSSPGAVAKLQIESAKAAYDAARAATEVARSSLKEAESSLGAGKQAVEVARAAPVSYTHLRAHET